jgi:probable F420-dependent oxidoreductase
MDFGLAMPRSMRSSLAGIERAVTLLEELGYDYVAITEHIVVPVEYDLAPYPYTDSGLPYWTHEEPWVEAMVTLGFIAGKTSRIKLLTSVIPNNTRDPLSLAKQAATVDLLSGGRLELGIGTGWSLDEAARLGHPVDHPLGRLEETLQILRLAWTEPQFAFRGRFYDYPALGVHPHPTQARVPIWLGGTSPRMIRLAAEYADGLLLPPLRMNIAQEIRGTLPDRVRMNSAVRYEGDFGAFRDKVAEQVEAGFDRFHGPMVDMDVAADDWEREIKRFAIDVLERLR